MKKIYVGNLPFTTTTGEIRKLFETHGKVHDVFLINDRDTGKPRGFGFVKMDDDAAGHAIDALNKANLEGRSLKVHEARPRANLLWHPEGSNEARRAAQRPFRGKA